MKKIFSIFLVCILLLSSIYSKTKHELTVFNNLKSAEITINNVKVDDDKSQILINELKNSKRKGILKLLCMFEIEIKTDDKIIKLKSNGGNLFSFSDNDIFFEMNTKLIEFINLTHISFVYKGTKYIITPEKNNIVKVDTEWDTKNIELSDSTYKILFTANENRNEKNLSKYLNDSSVTFYYGNDSKISFNLYEGESLFIELQEIVELFEK